MSSEIYPKANTESKTAIVTGAASGIGRAVADLLATEGWAVTGWDLSEADGVSFPSTKVDISDSAQVAEAAAKHDGVDLLVNCAGIGRNARANELSFKDWDDVIRVNLSGTFYCAKSLYKALRARRGLIVNIASIVAHTSGRNRAAYCSSKAAVDMLTRVLAVDWGEEGIRAIAISPGYTKTPMVENGLRRGSLSLSTIEARVPLGRLAEPEEIAGIIYALTRPEFRYLNGVTICADGGWTANGSY